MSSSARASTAGGIVRPRTLAVRRFTTNSKRVACSIGEFARLRTLEDLVDEESGTAPDPPGVDGIREQATGIDAFPRKPIAGRRWLQRKVNDAWAFAINITVIDHHQSVDAIPEHPRGPRGNSDGRPAPRTGTELGRSRTWRPVASPPGLSGARVIAVRQCRNPAGARHRFLEQFDAFGVELGKEERRASDVSTRSRDAGRQPRRDDVTADRQNDGGLRGRLFGRGAAARRA